MELDVPNYELELAFARKEAGLDLSVVQFDPAAHPRDAFGKFRGVLNRMMDDSNNVQQVHLPGGVRVEKRGVKLRVWGGKSDAVSRSVSRIAQHALLESMQISPIESPSVPEEQTVKPGLLRRIVERSGNPVPA